MTVWRWLAMCLPVLAAGAHAASTQSTCARKASATIAAQVAELERTQPAEVTQALDRIDDNGRKLLALRSYLRADQSIEQRWSWSQAQIDAYRDSSEYRDLLAEIEKIRARFEEANPGFELYANTEVRSLDQQLERWNSNVTVGSIATDLMHGMCEAMASQPKSAVHDLLIQWQPETPPPLAAPGLSLHGRARAVDFQVHQGSRVIAGPETAKIARDWVAEGWSARLASAVRAGSSKFAGPLKMPDEPWHYEYQPQ